MTSSFLAQRAPAAASGLGAVAAVFLCFASAPAGAQPAAGSGLAVTLPPILVSATRFADDPDQLPFGVSVLTADDIRASGASSVNEAVMKLLGVPGRLDAFGGGDYGLDVRGFGTTADSNQAVIVDGIKISEGDLGGTRLSGIAIDSVERIEIIHGNAAVLYGEGATGGAIVITTKAGMGGAPRANSASVYLGGGSDGLREARAGATLAKDGLSLDLDGMKREADNHRDNFRSKKDGFGLTAQWRNEWLRIGARYGEDYLESGLPGALTAAQYAADPRQTAFPDDHGSIRNWRHGAFAEAKLGDWQIALDAGWREKALRSINSGFAYDYDIDARTYAARARHTGRIGALGNVFVAGFDRNEWRRDVLGSFGATAKQRSHAVYLKDDLTLAGGTRFSAGWRSEQIDKESTAASDVIDRREQAWDIGVLQPLAGGVAVFGRFGRSFRLANADEYSFATPSAALQPQTSRDVELGARWTHEGGRAELRVYRSALTNEIGYDPSVAGPFGGLGANANFDPTRRQGIELEATQEVTAAVALRLNAATRRARFTEGVHDGRDVPLTPRHSASAGAAWTPLAGHKLDLLVNWISSQHPDFDNACKMPGYVTADLRYAYRYRFAELALGVQNVGDRKYYTQAFGCTADGQTTSIYPEAGRNFVASLRFDF